MADAEELVFPEDTITGNGQIGDWEKSPEYWNRLVLGDVVWPGVWTIEPSGEVRDLDKKKARGKHGRTIRDQGIVGGSTKCTGEITTEEWPEVRNLLQTFSPKKQNSIRTPIRFQHPAADIFGLNEVYVASLSVVPPKNAREFLKVEIMLEQWFPEPKEAKESRQTEEEREEALDQFKSLTQDFDPTATDQRLPTYDFAQDKFVPEAEGLGGNAPIQPWRDINADGIQDPPDGLTDANIAP